MASWHFSIMDSRNYEWLRAYIEHRQNGGWHVEEDDIESLDKYKTYTREWLKLF